MALFGRKKDEETEEEMARESNFSRRRLRDLNPDNKKKRKEPPKPWGKRERMSILIILLVTVIISAILAIGATGQFKFNLTMPKFDFSSLNIFKEQTIIIGKK
jgi:hypothetical protein